MDMDIDDKNRSYSVLIATLLSLIVGYYLMVFFHEWGHGTVAWLMGYKDNPFNVKYGGWLLLRVDEAVPYDRMLEAHHGVAVALIGITGVTVNVILFILSLIGLSKIKKGYWCYTFLYWFACMNMYPIFQYFTAQGFSADGDVGRFVYGLGISAWWVFLPGVLFIIVSFTYFFRTLVPKAYALLRLRNLRTKRFFLLASLAIVFLLVYTHNYTPLKDPGMPLIGKIFAVCSIILVPVLFFICNPSNNWVRIKIQKFGGFH